MMYFYNTRSNDFTIAAWVANHNEWLQIVMANAVTADTFAEAKAQIVTWMPLITTGIPNTTVLIIDDEYSSKIPECAFEAQLREFAHFALSAKLRVTLPAKGWVELSEKQFEALVGLPTKAFDLEKWEYSTLQEGGEEK